MAEEILLEALAQHDGLPMNFTMDSTTPSSPNLEESSDQIIPYPPNSIHEASSDHEAPSKKREKKRRRGRHEPEPEWSAMVRQQHFTRQKTTNRSRHACDRCRMKKSRCENSPNGDGCLGCWEAKLPCFVTDRVLNVTSIRGAPTIPKSEVDDLQQKLIELHQELHRKAAEYEKQISDRDSQIDSLTRTNAEICELLQRHRDRASYPETRHDGFTQATPFHNPGMGGMNLVSDDFHIHSEGCINPQQTQRV
ncbi:hypothetical protein N7456_010039 [Penicillium angulare]|uniref:Zn(2)-C6 fungal-type domain-containing protein n=1 Tax=Penicillium angulare TaxID=116970 RepID=A0A9W9F5U3_9EURO|nr:hypothetical protein N7456_010039 [Penicillium angulare]